MNPGAGTSALEPQLFRGKLEKARDQGLESQEGGTGLSPGWPRPWPYR